MDEPTADELTDNADNSKDAAYIPTLIPLLVLEEEAQNALVKQLKFSDQISRTARRIGLNPWSKADKDDADHEKDLLSLSFDLTKVAQQIAQSKERCHNTARAIEKVREMHDRYLRLHEGQSSQTFDPATDEVNARLDIVMEMVKGLIRRAERCQEDIQANIQTVRYRSRRRRPILANSIAGRYIAWCPAVTAVSTIKRPTLLGSWPNLLVGIARICG